MKKPVIASLDTKERQELIEHIHKSSLANDDKEVVVEALNFYNDILPLVTKAINILLKK